MTGQTIGRKITVTGVVQGVGFRPFVYRLARDHNLTGWVLNHSGGVDIQVEGPPATIDAFVRDLSAQAPPLARIERITVQDIPPDGHTTFEIHHSVAQADRYQLISPDIATCPDCLRELLHPGDRRYRYPFTNCTNCGPRFTIIADIPYDRPNTTMRIFPMCPDCQQEYDDPLNRRFHAQPNACPVCGPHLWLTDARGRPLAGDESHTDNDGALAGARQALLAGQSLAIKGLGGFHLACDATNAEAVRTLRQRKHRPHKPFAVMLPTLDEIKRHCAVTPTEEALLTSPQRPIVLLERLPTSPIVEEVAPQNRTLGVMLPYTPLHHLLLRDVGRPLVMTSGNLSEEPIARDNDEALQRLGPLADAFLLHNRDIYTRYDDSVWQVTQLAGEPLTQPLRRARSYAPFPITLPFPVQPILATGAELKNTFCLARAEYAFLSQHIGDMENLETLQHFEATLALYRHLFRLEPELIACDLHPDYLATKFAARYPAPAIPIQHHHAHIAACLADNGWGPNDGAVIGVALDGAGYGEDSAIWGGEWLVGDYRGFRRAAQLEYLPLPGGDAAIRRPWRIAAAYVHTLLGEKAVPQALIPPGQAALLYRQIQRRINTPLTSSMGRLFDAVSALLGICTEATYEAQGAIELEHVAGPVGQDAILSYYPFELEHMDGRWIVRLRQTLAALLSDLQAGAPAPQMSARFHAAIAQVIAETCRRIADATGLSAVALSGGCFQNRLLTRLAVALLQQADFRVLQHRQTPCNDGGLSLGQAVLAQAQKTAKEQ